MHPLDFAKFRIAPVSSSESPSPAAVQPSKEEIERQALREKIQKVISSEHFNFQPLDLNISLNDTLISELKALGWKIINSQLSGYLICFPKEPKEASVPTGWSVEHTAFKVYECTQKKITEIVGDTIKAIESHPERGYGVIFLPAIPTDVLHQIQQLIVQSGRECHHQILSIGGYNSRNDTRIIHQLHVIHGEEISKVSWFHGMELAYADQ